MSNEPAVHTTVVLSPHADVPVRLRGSVERTLLLAIGTTAEITLHETQARALRADIATALHDVDSVAAAERVAATSFDAGAQARRAAATAGERADAAERLGHVDLARRLRREAGAATEAADRAQQAAEDAAQAIDAAESATDRLDQILRGTPVPGDRSPRG